MHICRSHHCSCATPWGLLQAAWRGSSAAPSPAPAVVCNEERGSSTWLDESVTCCVRREETHAPGQAIITIKLSVRHARRGGNAHPPYPPYPPYPPQRPPPPYPPLQGGNQGITSLHPAAISPRHPSWGACSTPSPGLAVARMQRHSLGESPAQLHGKRTPAA